MRYGALVSLALCAACVVSCTSLTGASDFAVGAADGGASTKPSTDGAGDSSGGTTTPGVDGGTQAPPDQTTGTLHSGDFDDVDNATPSKVYYSRASIHGLHGTATLRVNGGDAMLTVTTGDVAATDQVKNDVFASRTTASLTGSDAIWLRMTASAANGTATTATVTIAGTAIDWIVTTDTPCAAQTVKWPASDASPTGCSAPVAALAPGASTSVLQTTTSPPTGETGHATVTCNHGTLGVSRASCGVPKVFDTNTATACAGDGYCSATSDSCSVDPGLADEFCKMHGFAGQLAYESAAPAPQAQQCTPDDDCYATDNAACEVIFTSITCHY